MYHTPLQSHTSLPLFNNIYRHRGYMFEPPEADQRSELRTRRRIGSWHEQDKYHSSGFVSSPSYLPTTDDGMIPATTRRVTSSSLAIISSVHGRQVARNACRARPEAGDNDATVAQLGEGRFQQTRGFSHSTPSRSALNFVLRPTEKGGIVKDEGKSEDPLGRPEHAVISTFDLFSIGGPCPCHNLTH